jgi:membrane protein
MKQKIQKIKQLREHPVVTHAQAALHRHRYSTPLFVLRETLSSFTQHHGLTLSASLSFYAMFALIPMTLLIFFLLSHLVVSSNYAIVKLAILTSNLIPKFSHRIMIEVYHISKHKAVWGVFGMFALFWAVTPLAGALRASFHAITATTEHRSFIRRTVKDALAVLSMLLLFFLFTFGGDMLDKVVRFLQPYSPFPGVLNSVTTLLLSTLLLATFFHTFFPVKVSFRHILIGAIVTASLWIIMRPAFSLFLAINQSYNTIFGSMKNMFISIGWLYYSFAVFLLGTELIATLRKKEILLLRALFCGTHQDHPVHRSKLIRHFGMIYTQGEVLFEEGAQSDVMFYVLSGTIAVYHGDHLIRECHAGDYFGEMAMLSEVARSARAIAVSDQAEVLTIRAEQFETLLQEDSTIAMRFLRSMAKQLRESSLRTKSNLD